MTVSNLISKRQVHRREFIGWVGGATAAWPLAAHAIAGTIVEPPDVQAADLSALMILLIGGF